MKIGFDLRPFLREETGVGTYLKNLLFHLARLDPVNEYYLFSASWKDRFPPDRVPPFARRRFCDWPLPVKLVNFFWYRGTWPQLDWFFRTKLDLTHSATPFLLPSRGKKIITIHDLYFLDFPEKSGGEAGKVFFRRLVDWLAQADGIITFSRSTRDEIIGRFSQAPEKIRVIPHGLDPAFAEDIPEARLEEARQKYGLPPSFLLFVGAQEPRKNLVRLLDALSILHHFGKKIPLILVGPDGQDSRRLRARAEELDLSAGVRTIGYVEQNELRSIYRLATAFVFPSWCEGFGFPLLEAMASGVPVVASSAPAIPEVCGDAALFFAPDDAEEMARKIFLVLEDSQKRKDLIVRGKKRAQAFSWEVAARETLAFYRAVVEERE